MRDKAVDGFRAIAALGVVFAHAVSYRYADLASVRLQALAEPLSQTSVQIFFVISGYIITTLLLNEEAKRGSVSIAAFYARRVCRIVPPLAAMYLALILLGETDDLVQSATFTCNIGDCSWYVGHTWSLAVEEQFYLCWPLILLLAPRRGALLVAGVGLLLLGFLIAPFAWHSNYISFACIGMGALYALRPIRFGTNLALWTMTAAALVVGPHLSHWFQAVMPFLIVYLIFAAPPIVKRFLSLKPIQLVGLASYSLYLWQQLFLGKDSTLPIWLLPVVVTLSVVLIEQPFIRLGRKWSSALLAARSPSVSQADHCHSSSACASR